MDFKGLGKQIKTAAFRMPRINRGPRITGGHAGAAGIGGAAGGGLAGILEGMKPDQNEWTGAQAVEHDDNLDQHQVNQYLDAAHRSTLDSLDKDHGRRNAYRDEHAKQFGDLRWAPDEEDFKDKQSYQDYERQRDYLTDSGSVLERDYRDTMTAQAMRTANARGLLDKPNALDLIGVNKLRRRYMSGDDLSSSEVAPRDVYGTDSQGTTSDIIKELLQGTEDNARDRLKDGPYLWGGSDRLSRDIGETLGNPDTFSRRYLTPPDSFDMGTRGAYGRYLDKARALRDRARTRTRRLARQ